MRYIQIFLKGGLQGTVMGRLGQDVGQQVKSGRQVLLKTSVVTKLLCHIHHKKPCRVMLQDKCILSISVYTEARVIFSGMRFYIFYDIFVIFAE